MAKAEKLFAGRDNLENLSQAVLLLEDSLKPDPSNYELLWRLSKYKYHLSDREKDEATKLRLLGDGIEIAKKAVALANQRPEGHFWLAANTGNYAELKGMWKSLRSIKTIRTEFETVFKIDPACENGGVYLALGEMDIRLPKLLGGNDRRGLALLESGLKSGSNNSDLKLFSGETYTKMGRKEEGKRLFQSILSQDDPSRTPAEQEEIRSRARSWIEKLR